ncbi:MAG: substrate-binding domain-containing protein, partial [Pannonibacter indicus]
DTLGGAGAEAADGFSVIKVAGSFAAPVPLAETLLAGWLLAKAGISVPSLTTINPHPRQIGEQAAGIIIEALGGKTISRQTIAIAPVLQIRGSSV